MLKEFLEAPQGKRVLMIAPHSDDETIQAGGLLSRLSRGGAECHALLVCGADEGRCQEMEEACAVLGISWEKRDYQDALLHEGHFPELVNLIRDLIRARKADLVIGPEPEYDYNPDHRLLGRATIQGAQKAGMGGHRPGLVISGEAHVPQPYPDYLVNADEDMDRVMEALNCHLSQLNIPYKQDYYTRLLEARCAWRGVQGGCRYAFAFKRLALPIIGNLYENPAAL